MNMFGAVASYRPPDVRSLSMWRWANAQDIPATCVPRAAQHDRRRANGDNSLPQIFK